MKRRRHLYQSKQPFDDHPFEAFFHDSWRTVELIRIKDGTMTMHLKDNQCYTEKRRPFSNLRIRSRKATSSDCTCFLRPGIDVCVLSASQDAECLDEENEEPVWVDAKISSIERKPHEGQCSCRFYVEFYVNPGPLGLERGALSKETKLVGIDQITILQKLGRDACEDQYYRWNFSEDCSSLQKTKMLLGKFSSDLSFLIVASVLKQTAFDIRSVQKKIVYQILGSDDDNSSLNSINNLNAINFKVEDGVSSSHLFQFIPPDTKEVSIAGGTEEVGLLPIYDVMNLQRSKRRNVQPDRLWKEMEIEKSSSKNESEVSENEPLWKEMELAMAEAYILEDNEGSNAGLSSEDPQISSIVCQHEFTLDEEIGILCPKCGFVKTEIKYVTPAFLEPKRWITSNKVDNEEDTEHGLDSNEGLNLCCNLASSDILSPNENDNVWALIPELKMKLHLHQKKAFEFLWRNIAGSLVPASMDAESKNTGGCVISHTPGAGKTFLIIAFLVSYLKLFPGKRALVLVPETTLYTWCEEFIKWKIPLPVHLIHGRRTHRVFRQKRISSFKGDVRPTPDVMHILDFLEKIQKWHAQPSILVMGYTSFLTLIHEDAKFAHRKYMAKVLRESPGIVVLDEGHKPRSTKSRLRKALMKVETAQRVLLSGTLFQNNFCEYFNTLCLARPKFIHEVLRELDQNFKRKKMRMKNPRQLESRARKIFVDTIARKINSDNGEERIQGLNMLRNITSGFIDVYEGGASDNLPGL
ncbi:SNF2 domain-containing protein CLASSY 1 [Citrus sinensis]|uniref:Helicase ATP-binding domain-containing protein n=1 Tax=Citrus clementina TaxID=85681 RepID=V4SMN5_CITCL|nr:SNF2 domain-containing protein CLASSY 1 [Citrus x clementina]XP_052295738.1 SNF2 domain-containing protein CLASSY 1-like [Citrus sinensis]GAY40500.1 hypothetical protein CUMW_052390 [Citrus unshiu]ESR49053.1 hypothetical protein CICLE_v10030786mg [Citrus x clementina]ESR49054.1 hypothetical protein CICLE_v10030786mg [Citrus x clementina]KAH9702669.1 SNF2 domain-containing protein CLASSY 1 [Citrus sinensis]GAY40501.1 hypothetical protein CUMW_052390 [Citrus unshiu]